MTIVAEKDEMSSSEDVIMMEHETVEECRNYLKSTEYCLKADGCLVEKFKLVQPNKIAKILSKPMILRGLPWKIFTLQNYKDNFEPYLCVSVVCDVNTEAFWSCFTRVDLIMTNFQSKEDSIIKKFTCLFSYKEIEHTFAEFCRMKELYLSNSPFVNDGFFEITLHIIAEPPRGLTWDSRKISGYVGIINQGATCYLNSLLQTLFFAEPLRKIIFKTPTESDNKNKSVVMALQFTFMDLLYSESSIDTKRLTLSFGWSPSEIYLQHDVQEMCRLLIDRVEERTKDTAVNGQIAKLLAGKLAVTIECTDVPFQSKRYESFYDIQLNVKNVKNIYESFDMYCAADVLDDDNKYNAGEFGLQKALKLNRFVKFPPLLHLHLLRFVFNPETFNYEKVYDRFEFYRQIKLGKYLLNDDEENPEEQIFYLQSVLVHCGSSSGGHYVAFVSPKCDSQWYKFDDDVVSTVSEKDAIQGTYGSNEGRYTAGYTAYMLLYIKESMLNDPDYKFSEQDIPAYIKNYYFSDHQNSSNDNLSLVQNHYEVNVICDDSLFLINNNTVDLRGIKTMVFTIPNDWTLEQMKEALSNHMGLPMDNIQFWNIKVHEKKTLPIFIPPDVRKNTPLSQYKQKFTLLIQRINNKNEEFVKNKNLMIFLHSFQVSFQKIYYLGFFMIDISKPLRDSLKTICQKISIRFHDKTLIFYEQEKFILKLITNAQEAASNIFDTSSFDCISLIIQNDYREDVLLNDSSYPFEYVSTYLKDLPFHCSISFFDVNMHSGDEPDFIINVSKHMTIKHLIENVAKHFTVDSRFIRLFRYKGSINRSSTISCNYKGTIADLFTEMNRTSDRQKLYYQLLKVPSEEYEHLSMYNMSFLTRNYLEKSLTVFVDTENITIESFLKHIREMAQLHNYFIKNPIRLINYQNLALCEITKDVELRNTLNEFNFPKIRIEEKPDNHINLLPTERLVSVNVKSHNNSSYAMEKSFLIKLNCDMDLKDVMGVISEITTYKVVNFSLLFYKEKVLQPFTDDITRKLPNILFKNSSDSDETMEQDISQTVTILIEISDQMPSRRYFRGDRSIRIN